MPGGQLTEGFLKSWCAVHVHRLPCVCKSEAALHETLRFIPGCRRGMILVSEIGDKTFFIAAVMAMKNRRATVSMHAGNMHAVAIHVLTMIGLPRVSRFRDGSVCTRRSSQARSQPSQS